MTDPNWPVWLYVAAWLLPLASFVLLVLGGKHWGKFGAYVACAAIIGGFALSFWGFVLYANESPSLLAESHGGHAAAEDSAGGHGSHYLDPQQAAAGSHHAEAGHATAPLHAPHAWKWSFDWITVGNKTIRVGFYVDNLTVLMFFMITMVASLIHIYSIGYMHEELHDPVHDPLAVEPGQPPLHRKGRFPRFFTYMSLFCFSMLGLVIADNVFMVFMFWELVGLCSYLLIGFYYERTSASNAANKAFITNRVGDAGMIVGMMIIWTSLGTFNIQDVVHTMRDPAGRIIRLDAASGRQLSWDAKASDWKSTEGDASAGRAPVPGAVQLFDSQTGLPREVFGRHGRVPMTIGYALLTVAGIGVFIGCVGKSAQFPLHVWLPDAMEGPTPVSALIHAATMVAAGVYLVGRFYALFTPEALLVIAYVGGITLFLGGTIALVMTDIKRVLAYSTVSQLGYMMLGLGVGGWAAGLFHLLTHAFFKALLFLCSGSVIHGTGTQEMPQMGGLARKMPITAITMLIGVLAIAGLPWFAGYYSKDAIVAQALLFWNGDDAAGAAGHPEHVLLFLLPAVGAAITAFYMFRLWFMTFSGEPRDAHVHEHAHESPAVMWLPLAILAVPSVIVGYGTQFPFAFVASTPLLERVLAAGAPHAELLHPSHTVHSNAGVIALAVVAVGIMVAICFYSPARVLNVDELPRQFPGLYRFLRNKWYFDELYQATLVNPALAIALFCRRFDWNVLDGIIDGSARWAIRVSQADGWFDFRVIDGIVNWIADWTYASGAWLRRLQTGRLRQYIVFLAVASVGLVAIWSFFGEGLLQKLITE